MKIEITSRSTEVTETARRLAHEKCGKLERFFHGHTSVRVILDKQHDDFRVELIATTPGKHTIVIEELHTDQLAAVDLAAARMERHVRKTKERLYERGRQSRPILEPPTPEVEEDEPTYQSVLAPRPKNRRTA
ncbi:MAG: ribosome-associated translation inhibitor RaiA [Planctomycetes bacterium]|nr:ribosome-associated translation inhibitor RaiA [Planctomycetota bacterium]